MSYWGKEDAVKAAHVLVDSSKTCQSGFSCTECPLFDMRSKGTKECLVLVITDNLEHLGLN